MPSSKWRQSSHLKYWLTPPEILAALHAEFHFDSDVCPYPLPYEGYSSLHFAWGKSNYVNPPFNKHDNTEGLGITAFCHKAIEEHHKGNQSVLILPTAHYANVLLEAGAEVRSMGRVGWISTETKQPHPSPISTSIYILRGNKLDNPKTEQRKRILTILLDAHDAVLKGTEKQATPEVQAVIAAAIESTKD